MFIIYIYIRVDLFSPKRFSLNNILIHSNFVHPDITEIRRVLEELSSYVTLLSGRLVRQLKRRDKNAFKLQRILISLPLFSKQSLSKDVSDFYFFLVTMTTLLLYA